MWTSYSARHAAQLIGLPESAVRSCIRDGIVGTPGTVPAQLTFRDLAALRTVKSLIEAGVPLTRVRKELVQIQKRLPEGTSLAELTVEARGGRVHLRGTTTPVDADGQLALPLELADLALLRPVVAKLGARATLHVIEGADHGFTRAGMIDRVADAIAEWIALHL